HQRGETEQDNAHQAQDGIAACGFSGHRRSCLPQASRPVLRQRTRLVSSRLMYDFAAEIADCAAAVEAGLAARLGVESLSGPGPAAPRVVEAMRHGALEGGKRVRPLLLRQAAAVFGVAAPASLVAGLAVEAVHCYSLVHDDLPAMDDDDLRRGRPTVH